MCYQDPFTDSPVTWTRPPALQTSHRHRDTEGLQILIWDPFHLPPAVRMSKGWKESESDPRSGFSVFFFSLWFVSRRPVRDSELGPVLLQILIVCGDGHKLVLVCRVKFIPRLRVIGLVPGDMGSFGQPHQINKCSAHSQTDEEELGDEARMFLSMLYCCPKYHYPSL